MPFYSYIKTLSKTPIRGLGEVKHRHAKNVEFSTNLLFAPDKLAQEERKTPKISVKRLLDQELINGWEKISTSSSSSPLFASQDKHSVKWFCYHFRDYTLLFQLVVFSEEGMMYRIAPNDSFLLTKVCSTLEKVPAEEIRKHVGERNIPITFLRILGNML